MAADRSPLPEGTLTAGVPLGKAASVLLLLHGRGATAADILSLGHALATGSTALIAPQAPGNTWYPLSFMAPMEQNEPSLSASLARIDATVLALESYGHARDTIALCGFSQGACLSCEYVARYPARYLALLAFTGGLIGPAGASLYHPGNLEGTPVLLSSGDPDAHVPWGRVAETAEQLQSMGAVVEHRKYPGRTHIVLPEEIAIARAFFAGAAER